MKISNGSFALSSSLAAKAIAGLALVAGLAACGDAGDDSAVPQRNETGTNNAAGGGTTGGGTTGGGTTGGGTTGGGTTDGGTTGGGTTDGGTTGGGTTDNASTNNAAGNNATGNNEVPGASELEGFWAQLVVTSAFAEAPFVGTFTTTTSSMLLLEVAHEAEGRLLVRSRTCAVKADTSDERLQTVIPDAFVNALPQTTRPGTVTLEANGSLQIDLPSFTEVLGARLMDLEREALPTSPTDARVFDQDGDGNPGLTVSVSALGFAGDVYVVQRGRNSLTGMVLADKSRWDGLVQWQNEQVTLGASNPIFTQDSPAPTVDPNANNSFFRTTRVSAAMDCATVVSTRDQLFAR